MVVLWKSSFILASTLRCCLACSGVRVRLSFFGPVFFVLDMVFLWLARSFCFKVGCLLTLHWGFHFDLLISIKGLLASIRGILYWGPLKLLMKYSPVTWMKSTEDVSMWDCASAIWCIKQYMLRYCLVKYFYFLSSEIDLCPSWVCLCSWILFRFEVFESCWLGGAMPSNVSSCIGICSLWVCPMWLYLVGWRIWKPLARPVSSAAFNRPLPFHLLSQYWSRYFD